MRTRRGSWRVIGKGFEPDGKGGNARKGIVWVARRIPDGYVSGHANQARITTFPLDDPDNGLYSPDVISFAPRDGVLRGDRMRSSVSATLMRRPISRQLRACEARVWSFFRRVADGMDAYTDYAMGHNPATRDAAVGETLEKGLAQGRCSTPCATTTRGAPMDMTRDLGAGGCGLPYRWRPMSFEVDGTEYVNERATATQQTGFWRVAQANRAAGDDLGDSVVRRRRCRHVVSYADLLLDLIACPNV
ncbi:C69 family dipeptidase [Alistipes communis]|uniref:C69 family dipeptidase n=1 Tax=Alistipes communis TaxID=2585118 RepID=UPI00242A3787|nr:C69 family dipeptidase [Alistipes communis]